MAVFLLAIVILLFNPIRSLLSFHKIEGFPLYSMTFYGREYDYLRFTVPQSEEEIKNISMLSPAGFQENQACTVFTATGGENLIYGRNRDLYSHNTALLLFTDPPDGYASVSIVDISQLWGNLESDQGSVSLIQRIFLLVSPLLPSEGMNEFGLTIAKADVPTDDVRPFDPSKDSLLFRTAMREVLDQARTIEEAIEILGQYNIAFGATGGHFMIADPSGDSVIVEYFDNQVQIIRNPDAWQVMTNFNVGKLSEGESPSCERYMVTEESLMEAKGQVSSEEAMRLLEQASIPETLWSVVFNMTDRSMDIVLYREYDEIYHVSLDGW
jgi:hypothetical protein